jgi:hypothetical protein
MENSKLAYEACLQENLDNPSECEALKRAYDADLRAYRATGPVSTTVSAVRRFFGISSEGAPLFWDF